MNFRNKKMKMVMKQNRVMKKQMENQEKSFEMLMSCLKGS